MARLMGNLANLLEAYGKIDGKPLLVANASIGTNNETELRDYRMQIVRVKVGTEECNEEITNAIRAVLAPTPPHLFYLSDYFLVQLQVNDWSIMRPYPISIRTEQLQLAERPVVQLKYLWPGCGRMHQYLLSTDVQNLFGFAHVNYIGQSLVDLASKEERNPPLVALKNDDVKPLSSGGVAMSTSNCESAWLPGKE